jgi:hypothetical protein
MNGFKIWQSRWQQRIVGNDVFLCGPNLLQRLHSGQRGLRGLSAYSPIVSVWVSFLASRKYEVAWPPTFLYVYVRIFLATTLGGYVVYRSTKKVVR